MGTGSDEAARGLAQEIVGVVRVTAFGTSIVAPAGSVISVLIVMMSYAGFASPLVVLISFAGSMCCAISFAELARRLPSAGWTYTYSSRGLGRTVGFLTGWMMVFGYAMVVPGGVALTSAYASLLAAHLHVTVWPGVLFLAILTGAILVAYLGIRPSSTTDLILVVGEMAVIAALAITILIKIGPESYSAAAFSPGSTPGRGVNDIATAMIYGIAAFAGFEAAAALSEEARNTRRSVPGSIIGIVVITGIFYLLVVLAETFGVGRNGIGDLVGQPSPLGYLASRYWSPSAVWVIDLVVVLTGLGFVVAAANAAIRVLFAMGRDRALPGSLARLSGRQTPVVAIGCLTVITLVLGLPLTYAVWRRRRLGVSRSQCAGLAVVLVHLAGNVAVIRAFRTEFRDEFKLGRHLLIPAAGVVIFLFPLWGILHPDAYSLVNLLPFIGLAWLCLGVLAAGVLRARRPAIFAKLGTTSMPGRS